jgi:hypothetical protein
VDVFNYHYVTKEFTGSSTARRSPLDKEEVYLIPASATTIKPPETKAYQAAVFDEATQKWKLVDDYRGSVFWLPNDQDWYDKITIEALGVTVPKEAILEDPGEYQPPPLPEPEPPPPLPDPDPVEVMIGDEMRALAIQALKDKGKLPPDYEDPVKP